MSKALNELKKATLASYLSKAGSRIRAGTSLGKSFDNDAGVPLKQILKHSPNVYDPNDPEGKLKDPQKLKDAQLDYDTNMHHAAKFRRQAQNTVKGVALAGKKLAKEEAIVEAGKNPYGPGYKLVDKDGKQLSVGHKFKDEDGEHHEVTGWQSGAQRGNSSSSGRVAVKVGKGKKAYHTEYFPHVFGMKVVKEDAEQIDEVSRSTIAKVATARYNQAQDALKKKDFGGYVKKMGKAIKASDATTPKTGWSPEDDGKKNEEVVPVLSAQEKYRQVKEARVLKAIRSATTHHNFYVAHEDLQKASKVLKAKGIPHTVTDHSKAPVDHSAVSVHNKHSSNAHEALKAKGIDFGGR